jgi:hypothetical protein
MQILIEFPGANDIHIAQGAYVSLLANLYYRHTSIALPPKSVWVSENFDTFALGSFSSPDPRRKTPLVDRSYFF